MSWGEIRTVIKTLTDRWTDEDYTYTGLKNKPLYIVPSHKVTTVPSGYNYRTIGTPYTPKHSGILKVVCEFECQHSDGDYTNNSFLRLYCKSLRNDAYSYDDRSYPNSGTLARYDTVMNLPNDSEVTNDVFNQFYKYYDESRNFIHNIYVKEKTFTKTVEKQSVIVDMYIGVKKNYPICLGVVYYNWYSGNKPMNVAMKKCTIYE